MARTPAADQEPPEPLHLVIIGGGIAGCAAAETAAHEDNVRVTLVNAGLPLGGTCINAGCLASRRLMAAAKILHTSTHHPIKGLDVTGKMSDFPRLMDQTRKFVAAVQREEYDAHFENLKNLEVIAGHGRFRDAHTVVVGDRVLEADSVIVATGAYDIAPPVAGIEAIDYLTGESLLDIDTLPSSLLFVGATEIGLACAQIYARFGTRVTLLEPRGDILDDDYGDDLRSRLLGYLREQGITILTGVELGEVRRNREGIELIGAVGGKKESWRAAHLVATLPRMPRTDNLSLEELDMRFHERGFIVVDETQQTSVAG
ncbi:MAG: FAD-dependent oxidoreductase, partial [Bradymonadaceae bacterium]